MSPQLAPQSPHVRAPESDLSPQLAPWSPHAPCDQARSLRPSGQCQWQLNQSCTVAPTFAALWLAARMRHVRAAALAASHDRLLEAMHRRPLHETWQVVGWCDALAGERIAQRPRKLGAVEMAEPDFASRTHELVVVGTTQQGSERGDACRCARRSCTDDVRGVEVVDCREEVRGALA